MPSDIIQDQDAYILATSYNFIPVFPLKYEPAHGADDDATFNFADGTKVINCMFKVNTDDLIQP